MVVFPGGTKISSVSCPSMRVALCVRSAFTHAMFFFSSFSSLWLELFHFALRKSDSRCWGKSPVLPNALESSRSRRCACQPLPSSIQEDETHFSKHLLNHKNKTAFPDNSHFVPFTYRQCLALQQGGPGVGMGYCGPGFASEIQIREVKLGSQGQRRHTASCFLLLSERGRHPRSPFAMLQ